MSVLRVTLIDVGWGDSLLVESETQAGDALYGLVDCNDTTTLQSSYIFLKRFFEKKKVDIAARKPVFEFVLLSHAHADHGQGLHNIIKQFGTKQLWYSKSNSSGVLANLIRYANNSSNVQHHQAVDSTKVLPNFGDAAMEVFWPPYGLIDENENNNSVVLSLTLGQVSLLLTGDAEGPVWERIAGSIPQNTHFFKVPHHGSVNGTFATGHTTPWLDHCPVFALLGISSHVRPFSHPHREVVQAITARGFTPYRTDEHYHITVCTDGAGVNLKYSH
ncbi:MAG: hypothetical protein Q7T82_15550 [Armatimonadota bacterium]|nr:hypothetical protein [Armatimonadota bacterium]